MQSRTNYLYLLKQYYRESNWLYKHVWYQGKSRGLHHGFADLGNNNHSEALINQYRYVIEKGNIKAGMKILDMGCGVGGAVVFIAKNTSAQVVGISLVKEQIDEARNYANTEGMRNLTTFMVGDYHHAKLPKNSFDVVYGIESICYASPKSKFLKEAWRLLKPGGVLIITDGYSKRGVTNDGERSIVAKFCNGWRLGEIIEVEKMNKLIIKIGFNNLKVEEKTVAIGLSVAKMKLLVKLWKVGEILIGWIDVPMIWMARLNAQAMEAWNKGINLGLFGYYAQVATKPKLR